MSAAGFGLHFRTWIRLYAFPGVMVEVNEVRSKPFTLTRSICQCCPLSPMLYFCARALFVQAKKVNPTLRCLTLPGSSEVARYTSYADYFQYSQSCAPSYSSWKGSFSSSSGLRGFLRCDRRSYRHPSEGGLGVPNIETRHYTLHLTFLDRISSQDTATGSFWKDTKSFPSQKSVHSADGEI